MAVKGRSRPYLLISIQIVGVVLELMIDSFMSKYGGSVVVGGGFFLGS